MVPPPDTSDKYDKPPCRPAMPSGTVRARRIHPRYRKGKARTEQNLEPAAPAPTLAPVSQDKGQPCSRSRPVDPKRNKPQHSSHQPKTAAASSLHPIPAAVPKPSTPPPHPPHPTSSASSQHSLSKAIQTAPPVNNPMDTPCPTPALHSRNPTESHAPDLCSTRPPVQPLQTLQNHLNTHQAPLSPRLIVDISPIKTDQSDSEIPDPDEIENTPAATVSVDDSTTDASRLTANSNSNNGRDPFDLDQLKKSVSALKMANDSDRPRPLICQDITNSNADTLRISRLPQGVTYDRLLSMVEPFGEVDDLVWTATDPYVCEVTYKDPAAAREAKHFLGDAMVGNDSEPPLKAELRSRDPGAQLFVGDLTPDVTEEMLEATFSELVGEQVSALLKRDPDSFSPIGYGFLSFQSESSANFALVAGHRVKVGNACVRVGRAERNTYLYVSDLAADVSASELKNVFGQFGSLVEEDTVIIRRSYAFIRYKNRGSAEKAKRTLDKTELKGRLSVRYAEAEPLKACVAVQFHSSVPRPPNSLRDLLSATFSKYGNCSVEIPRLHNGMWRKVAFVTFHGEPIAANLAALEAVQSIRFVSSLPVCCQFARELIPRFPSRGMTQEKLAGGEVDRVNGLVVGERMNARGLFLRKNHPRRPDGSGEGAGGRPGQQTFEQQRSGQYGPENGSGPGGPDFVPVYVPITALQHSGGMGNGVAQGNEVDFGPYQQSWQARMMMAQNGAAAASMHGNPAHFPANYNSFAPLQDRMMRW